MSGSHLSKDFFDLVKAIGESKSKQEEDRIICDEIAALKKRLHDTGTTKKKNKEFVIRLLYVEMLGHDASFGYIKAIELTAATSLLSKRCGYLASSLCLSPDHEFRFMLVNQLQRDLNSINHLEVCAALSAVAKLVTVDMVPAIINDIVKQLKHDNDLVRKKSIMVLHRFHQMDPNSVSHLGDQIRRTLCDKDPAVMGSSLCIFYDLIRANPAEFKDLVPSFVSILKQITEHRLPRDYDYHRMPAPWIQMRLLRILGMLGYADQTASEGMYEVLMEVMRRADSGINVGYAIVYEGVRTITTIYPNSTLLDAAAASITRFISSDNHNLKYVGVTGLAGIVKDHPRYALEHQLAVIDCLEDPDETLKRKTLDLLFRMTNSVNVVFVTQKLLHFLEAATDEFWRSDLVKRITQLAERFAPGNSWYVSVMIKVFELAGDLVSPEVSNTVMQLVADGSGEDDEKDAALRTATVDSFMSLINKPVLPDQLVQMMAWVLGEYGFLATQVTQLDIMDSLCELAGRNFKERNTKGFIVTSLMKLSAQTGKFPSKVAKLVEVYSNSVQVDLQQRCLEFAALLKCPQVMVTVLPVDASCEDVDVDTSLSFLDTFVAQALANGAVPYSPPQESDDDDDQTDEHESGLKYQAYSRPDKPILPMTTIDDLVANPISRDPDSGRELPQLKVTSQVWGRPKPQAEKQQPPAQEGSTPQQQAPAPPKTDPVPSSNSQSRVMFPSKKPQQHTTEQPELETKTPEQLEKERMAAMLFGGLVPGSQPLSSPSTLQSKPALASTQSTGNWARSTQSQSQLPEQSSKSFQTQSQATIPPYAAPPARGPPPPPVPPPAPAPAMVDLLDLAFEQPASPPVGSGVPVISVAPTPQSSQVPTTATLPSQPSSQPPTSNLDPFSALNELADSELSVTPSILSPASQAPQSFMYQGQKMMPLVINTPKFGEMWGRMRFEKKIAVTTSQINTTDAFVSRVSKLAGAHPVEAINQTKEVIMAGMFPELNATSLIHGKISPMVGLVEVTVRASELLISESLASFLEVAL